MGTDKFESTISLWDDKSKRNIGLKNLQTGIQYSFVLKRSFVIGRNRNVCDLQITTTDRYISGKHLRFINEDEVYIEDMNSKNGTRLNGKPVISRTRVVQGDILKLGRSEFEVIYIK